MENYQRPELNSCSFQIQPQARFQIWIKILQKYFQTQREYILFLWSSSDGSLEHRVIQYPRLDILCPKSLLNAGSSGPGCSGPIPGRFLTFQSPQGLCSFTRNLFQCLTTLNLRRLVLMFKVNVLHFCL